MSNISQTYNYMLLMCGDTDKKCIVDSYAQFLHEFGTCDGVLDAEETLYSNSGLLYVVQAKIFDEAKMDEVAEFGK